MPAHTTSSESKESTLNEWLKEGSHVYVQFHEFKDLLRRRKIRGSDRCSKETLLLIKRMLGTCKVQNTQQMMDNIRAVGVVLMDARPMELAIGNIVRRVLFFIREEFASRVAEEYPSGAVFHTMQPSLDGILADRSGPPDYTLPVKNLMSNIMGSVNELLDELDSVHEAISDQAEDHISDGSKILIFGKSRSVEMFLRKAAKHRNFQVIVCESAPYFGGQDMAKCLVKAGINTTIIRDSSVFAVMPLVDKVLLCTHAVMANGGLIAPSGSQMVALAAREHSVPVVCITSLLKLCPLYPHDLFSFNELSSPAAVLDYEGSLPLLDKAQVLNPEYDYVAPELLDLYVTNTGGHEPSYVYRLLAESYHPEDRSLD